MLLISTCNKEDNGDQKYLQAVDKLCDILKQHGDIKIVTNVWDYINVSNPVQWFNENVKICRYIILICTPLGKKNWLNNISNDLFVRGFQMLRNQRTNKRWFSSNSHNFSVIYFDDDPRLCIPDEMNQDKIKYKNISKNLNLFLKKVTSKNLDTDNELVVSFKTAVNFGINSRSNDSKPLLYENGKAI